MNEVIHAANSLTAIQQMGEYDVLRPVATLPEMQEEIRLMQAAGLRLAARISVLLSMAKDDFFADDYRGWQRWAQESFHFQKRFIDLCRKAGTLMLAMPDRRELQSADLAKLELVARIPEHSLSTFLDRVPINEVSREDLRRKVKLWEDPDEGDEEPPEEPPEEKQTPERRPTKQKTLENLIDTMAEMNEEQKRALLPFCDPQATMHCAWNLLHVAFSALEMENFFTTAQWERHVGIADEAALKCRQLAEEVG